MQKIGYKRISLVILLLSIFTLWFTSPKQHTTTLQGISYQLGTENTHIEKRVEIYLDGKLQRGLLGDIIFKGNIDIENVNFPVPENERQITIKNGEGHLAWGWYEDGNSRTYSYGTILTDEEFKQITILKHISANSSTNNKGWTSKDGHTISAPANNRMEAIEITNKLKPKLKDT
ncbi:hypothetical protein GGQ84_002567 [Desulfitispora alkaliphila]|uniref:hypothetical protein n=1 Tax=Desulfitispora alkaliphila TaxID=622674 RepID=UPI003D1EF45C